MHAGEFQKVPILIGTNREEYRVFVALQERAQASPIGAAQYIGLVNGTFGAGATAVLGMYPLGSYAAPGLAQAALLSDLAFACPTQTTASLFSAQVDTYAYEFDDPAAPIQVPGPFIEQRSYHGAELPYLHRQPLSQFGFGPVAALSTSQQGLADQMVAYWAHFAAAGNPNARVRRNGRDTHRRQRWSSGSRLARSGRSLRSAPTIAARSGSASAFEAGTTSGGRSDGQRVATVGRAEAAF